MKKLPLASLLLLAHAATAMPTSTSSPSALSSSLSQDAQPVRVAEAEPVLAGTTIKVDEKVQFDQGKAAVLPASTPLLQRVADFVTKNPSITKLLIEGHTDDQGGFAQNQALSKARAEAVKAVLTTLGVPAARMETVGYGAARPIASNTTPAGREKNRRVEFTMAEQNGKRVVKADPPIAEVTAKTNLVEAHEPKPDTSWVDAKVGLDLFEQWKVSSQKQSAADVTFRDSSLLHLRENTLVIIFGSYAGTQKSTTTQLEKGSLKSRLSELSGSTGKLTVKTPSAEADLATGEALVTIDEGSNTRVANHGGKPARVFAQGRRGDSVTVPDGMGSMVKRGLNPSAPRPLPPAPGWGPDSHATFIGLPGEGATVSTSWNPAPNAHQYRVEISRGADGADVVQSATVPANVTHMEAQNVPAGAYFVSVSTIDNAGFESKPSPRRPLRVAALDLTTKGVQLANNGGTPRVLVGTRLRAPEGTVCSVNNGSSVADFVLDQPGAVAIVCTAADGVPAPAVNLVVSSVRIDRLLAPSVPPALNLGATTTMDLHIGSELPLPEGIAFVAADPAIKVSPITWATSQVGTVARINVQVLDGVITPAEIVLINDDGAPLAKLPIYVGRPLPKRDIKEPVRVSHGFSRYWGLVPLGLGVATAAGAVGVALDPGIVGQPGPARDTTVAVVIGVLATATVLEGAVGMGLLVGGE